MHFVGGKSEKVFHKLVRFADKLHIAVLDAVMYHFYEMSGAVLSDPVTAGRAVLDLRANRLKYRLNYRPSRRRAARHERRSFKRALFAAGNPRSYVEFTLALNVCGTSCGIRKMRVTAVYDNVAVVKQRQKFFYHIVDSRSGFYHHHYLSRLRETRNEFFERVSSDDVFALRATVYEIRNFFCGAVEYRDGKTVSLHIHNEIFAHYGKSYKTNVRFFHFSPFVYVKILFFVNCPKSERRI